MTKTLLLTSQLKIFFALFLFLAIFLPGVKIAQAQTAKTCIYVTYKNGDLMTKDSWSTISACRAANGLGSGNDALSTCTQNCTAEGGCSCPINQDGSRACQHSSVDYGQQCGPLDNGDIGDECYQDSNCNSGICSGSKCVANTSNWCNLRPMGNPPPTPTNGETCINQGKICDEVHDRCISGQIKDKINGSDCAANAECMSGVCHSNKCVENTPNWCADDHCGAAYTCDEVHDQCIYKTGGTPNWCADDHCGYGYYCNEMNDACIPLKDNGSNCSVNAECKTDSCKNICVQGTSNCRYMCVPKLNQDNWCADDHCGYGYSCDETNDVCIPLSPKSITCFNAQCQSRSVTGSTCPTDYPLTKLPTNCQTSGGNKCTNPPYLDAKKYIKFTCPNGCTQTTEGGVTAWRCYENRVDSATPISLGGACGQVDILSGDSDSSFCGTYEYTCGETRCQTGGSSPQPSASPSTPPGPMCLRVTLSKTAPKIGDAITLTCAQVTGAHHYQFRIKLPNGSIQNLAASTANPTVSEAFTVTSNGAFKAQCRICTGAADSTCQAYEAL